MSTEENMIKDVTPKRPLCEVCGEVELTSEEIKLRSIGKTSKRICYFCYLKDYEDFKDKVGPEVVKNIPDPMPIKYFGREVGETPPSSEPTKPTPPKKPAQAVKMAPRKMRGREQVNYPPEMEAAPSEDTGFFTFTDSNGVLNYFVLAENWTDEERKEFMKQHGYDPAVTVRPKPQETKIVYSPERSPETTLTFIIPVDLNEEQADMVKKALGSFTNDLLRSLMFTGPGSYMLKALLDKSDNDSKRFLS